MIPAVGMLYIAFAVVAVLVVGFYVAEWFHGDD